MLAGAITRRGRVGVIQYVVPLIPEAAGWLGFLLDVGAFVLSAGAIVLAIALSPAISMLVGGLLFDFAAERVEKTIGAPKARKVPLDRESWERRAHRGRRRLLLNLLFASALFHSRCQRVRVLHAQRLPDGPRVRHLAGMRRMPFSEALALRRSARFSVFLVGLACSVIPFLAPLVAASAMTRLVNRLAR